MKNLFRWIGEIALFMVIVMGASKIAGNCTLVFVGILIAVFMVVESKVKKSKEE